MANGIANRIGVCNAVRRCNLALYGVILQMANKIRKLCV